MRGEHFISPSYKACGGFVAGDSSARKSTSVSSRPGGRYTSIHAEIHLGSRESAHQFPQARDQFEQAIRIFADPYAMMEPDGSTRDEERWRTIGIVEGTVLILFVAHTLQESDEEETNVRMISARVATRMRPNAMRETVKISLDELAPLTEEEKDHLNRMAVLPDSAIDLSDLPEATEQFWTNARPLQDALKNRQSGSKAGLSLRKTA